MARLGMRSSLLYLMFDSTYDTECADILVSHQEKCAVIPACIIGGCSEALVCCHPSWCSGLSCASLLHSLLAVGCIVGASMRSLMLELTLVPVELPTCAVIPACVAVSP